jgi:hypothetical protein
MDMDGTDVQVGASAHAVHAHRMSEIICAEVTPTMIRAGVDFLHANDEIINSGKMSEPDLVARVFAAMRLAQG